MLTGKTNSFIKKLNYKDFLIILGTWYFMAALNYLMCEFTLENTPHLTGLFHFLYIAAGRFIYLALIIFYLIYLYPISFEDLGLSLTGLKKQLLTVLSLIIPFFIIILVFVNIPLSYNQLTEKFSPLYQIQSPQVLIQSLFPLLIFFIPAIIIALSEQFLLNKIIFELFSFKLHRLIALIMASLFYSILFLNFQPTIILINFLTAFISIYLYIKAEGSLITASIFSACYYTFYIVYIYGWDFLNF